MKFHKWQERQRRRWELSECKKEERRVANMIKEEEAEKAREWVDGWGTTTSTTGTSTVYIEWEDNYDGTPTFHSRVGFDNEKQECPKCGCEDANMCTDTICYGPLYDLNACIPIEFIEEE